MEIKLKDKSLVIIAENGGHNRPYVQKAWLNDKRIDRHWLQHAEIANGGTLKFEMGDHPAKEASK